MTVDNGTQTTRNSTRGLLLFALAAFGDALAVYLAVTL